MSQLKLKKCPVVNELVARCQECQRCSPWLWCRPRAIDAVTRDLAERFHPWRVPAALVPALHQRTDGHLLFMVTMVDHLVRQGRSVDAQGRWEVQATLAEMETGVPESLRQMIEHEFAG